MTPHVAAEVTAQVATFCREPQPAKAIMAELGLKHLKTFQANYLAPLVAMGILERTIPDKPRSRMQRYRTTEAGVAMLEKGITGAPKQGRALPVHRRAGDYLPGLHASRLKRVLFPRPHQGSVS
jgi:hypothetical protein